MLTAHGFVVLPVDRQPIESSNVMVRNRTNSLLRQEKQSNTIYNWNVHTCEKKYEFGHH